MPLGTRSSRYLIAFVVLGVISLSGLSCVWGVVRDADTGAPLGGAEIQIDTAHNFRIALTDANGIYCFDPALGDPVFPADASFVVYADGHEVVKEMRPITYSNGDLRNFQLFDLLPEPGRFHDKILGFSISYPPTWRVWAHVSANFNNSEASSDEGFCGVDSDIIPNSETPESWWQHFRPGYEVVERGKTEVAGHEATRLVYTEDYPPRPVKGLLFLFQRGHRAWVIRCDTSVELFDAQVDVFNGVAASFKFD